MLSKTVILIASASCALGQISSLSELASAAVSSAVSSAVAPISSAIASASPSGSASTGNVTYAYDCPAGTVLTYGITNATFPGVSLDTAVAYFSNCSTAAPGQIIESTDTTRTYIAAGTGIENFTVSEVLNNSTVDPATGALHQTFNTTSPIEVPAFNISIAIIYSDLQVYANETTNATTLQYFFNLCTNNQEATSFGLPQILAGETEYWRSQLVGASTSASASGIVSSASGAASSAVGGILPPASSALNSITAGPSSILASATSAPAALLSSATGAIASALPSLRMRARWL